MSHIPELTSQVPITVACDSLGLSRSHYYRQQNVKAPKQPCQPKPHPRALKPDEEAEVRALLNSPRFADSSPYEVYGTLLDDDGRYLCSVRTMYRILEKHDENKPRGRIRSKGNYQKPELLATQPNQVWSWDITKLRASNKWVYYYMYVMLDIFSRFVVGWLIAPRESAELAQEFIASCYLTQGVSPDQLTIHADRGAAMTSKGVAHLLADLGVTKTHSRPYTSNDNPYSEAQFKTVKYRPDYPDRFGSLEDARSWAADFFDWYNHQHRHTSLALMTPAMVHAGRQQEVKQLRQSVLAEAYQAHPERFVQGLPQPETLSDAVWINPPKFSSDTDTGAGA